MQEIAEARINKDATENVKLKMANENRVIGIHLLLKNIGIEATSDKAILRLSSINNAEKFNSSLLIVPGIEGVANITWQAIASSLNLPAFILQLTNVTDTSSFTAITNAVIDQIISCVFKKLEFFYLIGYSFGTLITFEIARALEEIGMKGYVVLIDGAPTFLKQLSYGHIGAKANITDEMIQHMLILGILRNVFPEDSHDEVLSALGECNNTWVDRINCLIQFSSKLNLEHSESYLRDMIDSLFNRLKMVFDFDADNMRKIKSSITLIRPTEVAVVDIEEDYELSKYTEGSVDLKFVEGNHATMLDNPRLSQIINDVDPNLESDRNFKAYVWSGKNT